MTAKAITLKPTSQILSLLKGHSNALAKVPPVNPRDRYVVLFPGSEHVYVGMALRLLNSAPAEKVFMEANELLNRNMLKLLLEGPKSELLGSLENRNLAAFITSHAIMTKLAVDDENLVKLCKSSAGIGVGFINGLVFGGGMTFSDGLDLIQKQARVMDRMAGMLPNAKLKVRLRPGTSVHKVCRAAVEHCLEIGISPELAICSVTRYISAHVLEIGGHEEAIKYLETEGPHLFEFYSIHRVINNPKAYHTSLMEPASRYTRLYIEWKLQSNPDFIKEPLNCSTHSATAGCRVRNIKEITRDISEYAMKPQKVEQVLLSMFRRPAKVPMPNTLIIWDKFILKTLGKLSARAARFAKLIRA